MSDMLSRMNNTQFKTGEIVRIKPEWCNSQSESDRFFVIREWNGDRGYIELIDSGLSVAAVELVRSNMIEVAAAAQ